MLKFCPVVGTHHTSRKRRCTCWGTLGHLIVSVSATSLGMALGPFSTPPAFSVPHNWCGVGGYDFMLTQKKNKHTYKYILFAYTHIYIYLYIYSEHIYIYIFTYISSIHIEYVYIYICMLLPKKKVIYCKFMFHPQTSDLRQLQVSFVNLAWHLSQGWADGAMETTS